MIKFSDNSIDIKQCIYWPSRGSTNHLRRFDREMLKGALRLRQVAAVCEL